ncbi:endo-1,4-beta-xylanase [Sphingomonas sp. HT-1]|uniref:endo-1,4-beta-xylanase n=1 Tax=unclassified Sphingomonas TaxID=196159 RepID=UPI0002DE6B88|nr:MULTISPECIES: endo-1,4-beta-xylanase [unclassified Sphingomonas]KTF67383.1 glycosyl hydrolase [Sphingomonas sp. WG]
MTKSKATRREVLGGAGAMAATLPIQAHAARAIPGLNTIAGQRGLRFGSAFAWSPPGADAGSFANPAYAALLQRDCGILVAENQMKWQAIRPSADGFDFSRFDAMLDWAEAHRMAMRGHTLLWHKSEYFPRWLNNHDFGAAPLREAERVLDTHVRTVCGRYGRRIGSYDVVNETVDEKTGDLRDTSLSRAFGGTVPMLDHAFRTARAAAPHAQLVYNDYMSWEPGNEKHRAGVLRLLEGFRKRDVPVDALGVQSHIEPKGDGTPGEMSARQEKPWRAFLDTVTAMGYDLVITEFDVADQQLPGDFATRDRIVADYAGIYLDIMLGYPQLRDVLAWGMCDKYSWLNGFKPRRDGSMTRVAPYDARFRPKPLHDAIARQLMKARART